MDLLIKINFLFLGICSLIFLIRPKTFDWLVRLLSKIFSIKETVSKELLTASSKVALGICIFYLLFSLLAYFDI